MIFSEQALDVLVNRQVLALFVMRTDTPDRHRIYQHKNQFNYTTNKLEKEKQGKQSASLSIAENNDYVIS